MWELSCIELFPGCGLKWKITMNDEFMHQLYEEPRPEFGDALYERISREPLSRFAQIFVSHLTFRYAAIAFVSLFVIAAGVYVAYQSRWNRVGGIWVDVQQTLTIEVGPPEIVSESELGVECLTVEEAKEILRFDFKVPTWAPEGYTFDNRICGLNMSTNFASLSLGWQGPDEYSGIHIMPQNLRWFNMASQEYEVGTGSTFPVGLGSYEEVEVNGQPAVLVHGSWDDPWNRQPPPEGKWELKWDKTQGLQLYWVEGEVLYWLNTLAEVSPEDLIRMAESAQ
jgi:hypothetical protein